MPTENKSVELSFDLNTSDGGRGYIANLFKTVLKRHDYRQYISERLAGDFACTLAQHLEGVKAREQALQLRLNADQRNDDRDAACEWSQEDDSGIWNSDCGTTWSFHDDGPEENGMHFCHSCGKALVVAAADAEPVIDDDWHMNPCKQGHRDVGAAGGVAACNQCDEKIEAATTQKAFEQWNATHPPSTQSMVRPFTEQFIEGRLGKKPLDPKIIGIVAMPPMEHDEP